MTRNLVPRQLARAGWPALLLLALAACGGNYPNSTFLPTTEFNRDSTNVWNVMMWLGTAVFDPPARRCALYAEWRGAIPDARLTLVFPAYHLNSPSSMFGHTLLRLDPARLAVPRDVAEEL